MEVDHPHIAGDLMQPVDILGQQNLTFPDFLQPDQSAVSIIGLSPAKAPPAHKTPRPIATARRGFTHKGLKRHGLRTFPVSFGITIIRDSRIRTTAGTGQNEEPVMTIDEVPKDIGLHHGTGLSLLGRCCQGDIPDTVRPRKSEQAHEISGAKDEMARHSE
jgi:hypothetical protein